MPLRVVLDACVLYPLPLRDTVLRAAQERLYQPCFTEAILEEVRRNLVKNGRSAIKAQSLIEKISQEFNEALVSPHPSLVASMPNHSKDRHVLAAAVAAKAGVIVTSNLRHFPGDLLDQYAIEAWSPDDFLTDLFYVDSERMARALSKQAGILRSPAMTVLDVLENLKLQAPNFVELMTKEYVENYEQFWSSAFAVNIKV